MVQWIPSPDPVNQVESRKISFSCGRIEQNSSISIPQTLYNDINRLPSELQKAFDELVVGFSQTFDWHWKGTRYDFRFGKPLPKRIKPLTVLCVFANESREFVLVEIRQDELNFRDEDNLFPDITPSGKRRRGKIYNSNSARAMVESVSRQLRLESRPIDFKKTDNINAKHGGSYLPTREDVENAHRKCLREGKKEIPTKEFLDFMENELKDAGHTLVENWRSVTEKNIAIWSQKKD